TITSSIALILSSISSTSFVLHVFPTNASSLKKRLCPSCMYRTGYLLECSRSNRAAGRHEIDVERPTGRAMAPSIHKHCNACLRENTDRSLTVRQGSQRPGNFLRATIARCYLRQEPVEIEIRSLSRDPKLRKTSVLSYRMGLDIGIPILLRPKDDSSAVRWINHTNQLLLRLLSHNPIDTTSSCSSSAISLRLPDRCVAFRVSPD